MRCGGSFASLREEFYFPVFGDQPAVYFTGNSLGLQPRTTQDYPSTSSKTGPTSASKATSTRGTPGSGTRDFLTEQLAQLLGAKPVEVVSMGSLTTNLHLLFVSFYRPTKTRYKIMVEYDAFPSDPTRSRRRRATTASIRRGGDPPQAPGRASTRCATTTSSPPSGKTKIPGDGYARSRELLHRTVLRPRRHRGRGHAVGATCGFNLAHATGNVLPALHDWNVDYACFCSCKYLNAGPGGVSGIFVHERFADDASCRVSPAGGATTLTPASRCRANSCQPAAHAPGNKATRPSFDGRPARLARRLSKAGMMEPLRRKSLELTGYLEYIVAQDQPAARAAAGGDHHACRSCAARLPTLDDRAPERPQGLRSPCRPTA